MNPNPYRDVKPFNRVRIGGRLIKSVLKAINGAELEDIWNVQQPTGNSKATAVYRGTKLIENVTLTFVALGEGIDDLKAAAEAFDDLGDLYQLMAPTQTPGRAGPAPPTLSIENAILTWIGLTAINRRSWKGPYVWPDENGTAWAVDLGLIQNAPPSPAGVGPQASKAPDAGAPAVDPQIKALQDQRDALLARATGT